MKNTKNTRNFGVLIVSAFAVSFALLSFAPVAEAQLDYYYQNMYIPIYTFGQSTNFGYYSSQGSALASALAVSCAATPASARVGDSILWYASVTGGAGNEQYFWSGTDGLYANTASVRRAYDTTGIKYATVTVTSGGQSVTAGCTNSVNISPASPPAPAFAVSCYAAQERIAPGEAATWLSVVSGVSRTATTTYEWQGTDALSGSAPAAIQTYRAEGLKHAILTVTSGPMRAAAACANAVAVAVKAPVQPALRTITKTIVSPAPLQALCSPSRAKAEVGEEILWSAVAIGGAGKYGYLWKGDEELAGGAATTSKRYESEGTKTASVTVLSADKSVTVSCTGDVEVTPKEDTGLLAAAFFGGWTDTILLIGGTLLAILIAFILASRKKKQDEEEAGARHSGAPVFLGGARNEKETH